jgi:hypothetical protein
MLADLPDDIICKIIEELSFNKEALSACALTHRTWLPHARAQQFRTITIYNRKTDVKHEPIPRAILNRVAQYASYIRILTPGYKGTLASVDFYAHLYRLAPFLSSRLRGLFIDSASIQRWDHVNSLSAKHQKILSPVLQSITELHLDDVLFGQESVSNVFRNVSSIIPNIRVLVSARTEWFLDDFGSFAHVISQFDHLTSLHWQNQHSDLILQEVQRSSTAETLCSLFVPYNDDVSISLASFLPVAKSLQRLGLLIGNFQEAHDNLWVGQPGIVHSSLQSLELVSPHYHLSKVAAVVFPSIHFPALIRLDLTIEMFGRHVNAISPGAFNSLDIRRFFMLETVEIRIKKIGPHPSHEISSSPNVLQLIAAFLKSPKNITVKAWFQYRSETETEWHKIEPRDVGTFSELHQ